MKFITEIDLRALYKIEPFAMYELEAGSKLTPGARQFLIDKGINVYDDVVNPKETVKKEATQKEQEDTTQTAKQSKVCVEISLVEAEFLCAISQLLPLDGWLSRDIADLCAKFAELPSIVKGELSPEKLGLKQCEFIRTDNYDEDLGDCFRMQIEHIKHEKATQMIILNKLRCVLRRFVANFEEFCGNKYENTNVYAGIKRINQIINILTKYISDIHGGEQCLRKM